MPNRNKQKGDRFETQCVDIAKKHGFTAQKVPLSGAAEGIFSNDIHIKVGRERWELECKKRARGFKFLYDNSHLSRPTLMCISLEKIPSAAPDSGTFCAVNPCFLAISTHCVSKRSPFCCYDLALLNLLFSAIISKTFSI